MKARLSFPIRFLLWLLVEPQGKEAQITYYPNHRASGRRAA